MLVVIAAGCGGASGTSASDMTAFPAHCSNGMRDADETDLDCGASCMPCGTGKGCQIASDCQSGLCANRACLGPSCSDGIKNGAETDVDCAGTCPEKCAEGKHCGDGPDCKSGLCLNAVCGASLCTNGKKDGDETDVDCGGAVCGKCAEGKSCLKGSDCVPGKCAAGKCVAPTLSFGMPVSYAPLPPVTNGLATGDLDGDKLDDVVIISSGLAGVNVRLSSPGGVLRQGVDVKTHMGAHVVTIVDIDGDKARDLLTVNAWDAQSGITTLLGKGDGTFGAPTTSPVQDGYVMSDGDFNGDGKLDVVTLEGAIQRKFGLNYGDGTGRFLSAGITMTPESANGAAAGDFNGDGRDDLAVVYFNIRFVYVYLAQVGGFKAPATYPIDGSPASVAAADLTGDGKVDLVVSTFKPALDVFVGGGDGTFLGPDPYPAGGEAGGIGVADFNRDGHVDLAVGNAPAQVVDVLLSDGKGRFLPKASFPAGGKTAQLVVGDLDGNGLPDLVTLELLGASVVVLLNTSN